MAMVNVKQIIQDLIIPEFRTLSSEIKRVDETLSSNLKRLDEKMTSEIRRLDEKIEFLREDIRNIREDFKIAIDIHERIASLEAKLAAK